jgi:A/G-specific adenine glycosylase
VPAPSGGRSFAARLLAWQAVHGRHDLPWQADRDPYRVWLSEVMLQQTQVATVIPYFTRFCARFPDVMALAAAPLVEVLSLWAGLGYYARARNLHACAKLVVERFGGRFPLDAPTLAQLPGIGRSTAAAIAAFCASAREPILDGNVKRVLARHFAVAGDPSTAAVERVLCERARSLLPTARHMPAFTQGLMDLGATVCTRHAPRCGACPVARTCIARATGRAEHYPAARTRGPLPARRAWALLAVHGDRVLLQRRAPAGVWGGLYALPQFESAAALRRAAAALDAAPTLRALPPRRHVFTHFALTLIPRRLDVRVSPPALREDDLLWLPLTGIESAPLPAPVLAILREAAGTGEAKATAGAAPIGLRTVGRVTQPCGSASMPRATRKRDTML